MLVPGAEIPPGEAAAMNFPVEGCPFLGTWDQVAQAVGHSLCCLLLRVSGSMLVARI